MNDIVLTEYAYSRLRKRAGIKKEAAERLSTRAYSRGIDSSDTSGRLKRFLENGQNCERNSNATLIYGEFVCCFLKEENKAILLTAYWLPQNLKKQAIAAQRRKTA